MSNLELMLKICKDRKDDLKTLFTGVEIDLFNQCVLKAVQYNDNAWAEEIASSFVSTFNERIILNRHQ
jgi:hypothetical protein